jgi:ribose 5-phosphate isomerase A
MIIPVTIDGADDVDDHLNLVKGGGGALLREKMVASSSDQVVIIVDESKLSKSLGPSFPVPVEIVQFNKHHTIRKVSYRTHQSHNEITKWYMCAARAFL